MINPNTIKNEKILYYTPSIAIDYFLVFFSLMINVNIDDILKK